MRNLSFKILALFILIFSASYPQNYEPVEINLWEGEPPGMVENAEPGADDGTGRYRNVGIPSMFVYLPDSAEDDDQRIAIIVCPGGAYTHLTRLIGADGAANVFLPKNVVIISLKYRTRPPSVNVQEDALADAKRAVRLTRYYADEWNIDPGKIGMIGWSAGANLILNLATHFDYGDPASEDPIERESSRPDFISLLVPWPADKTIEDYPVTKNSPPAFIGAAEDDKTAPVSFAKEIADRYQKAGVENKLMIVETGGHGAFQINIEGEGGKWVDKFWPWLKEIGVRE